MGLLDRLRKTVAKNRRKLAGVAKDGARRIVQASEQAAERVVGGLRVIAPGQFGSLEVRDVLGPVTAAVERAGGLLGIDVAGIVQSTGESAAGVGRVDISEQLKVWDMGAPLTGDLIDPGLLEYYQSGRQRYGLQAISRMRDQLAQSALAGETIAQTSDRLEKAIGLERYQAERIARTEASAAFHRRWLRDAQTALGDDVDAWRKQLVATFDARTGLDSRFVHGQQRKLDLPFRDNEGRVYLMPPNRPNDRETVILVRADFSDA